MSKLGWIGVFITFSYLCSIGFFQWQQIKEIDGLELNAFGDFLAGVFGPVAIFWLVLGFFQQGVELRNSIQSLDLQTQELRQSVEQQKKLVEVSASQLEIQRTEFEQTLHQLGEAVRPNFIVSYLGIDDDGYSPYEDRASLPLRHKIGFANIGGTACKVELFLGYGSLVPDEGPIIIWPQFEKRVRQVELFASDTHGDSIQLDINYQDALGRQFFEEYAFIRKTHGVRPHFVIERCPK